MVECNINEILKNRKFNLSSGANEWAGSGIYFFIDEDDNVAENNAKKWAEYIKNIKSQYIAIVIVNLKVINAVVLDLNDRNFRQQFHKYREAMFHQIVLDAESKHKRIEDFLQKSNWTITKTDMYANCVVTKKNRDECVKSKMNEFASAKIVITDRLHGMIFSAITGTPCIVFGNYNYKVEGTYEWIKYLGYIRFVDTVDEMERVFPELISLDNCEYDNTPLLPDFEKIVDVLKQWESSV